MVTRFGMHADGPPPEAMAQVMAKLQPLGRLIDPMDVAKAALFLASDQASNITGVNLPVDGGVTAGR
jgi:NAD(P)-dependent dehydrogenase (short-subunit alcohol dehydrogenase family)